MIKKNDRGLDRLSGLLERSRIALVSLGSSASRPNFLPPTPLLPLSLFPLRCIFFKIIFSSTFSLSGIFMVCHSNCNLYSPFEEIQQVLCCKNVCKLYPIVGVFWRGNWGHHPGPFFICLEYEKMLDSVSPLEETSFIPFVLKILLWVSFLPKIVIFYELTLISLFGGYCL